MPHPTEINKQEDPDKVVLETDVSARRKTTPLVDITTNMVQPETKEDSVAEVALTESDLDLTELPERTLADGSTYTGQWFRSLPHGNGMKCWPDGKRYHGEFHDGKATGIGSCNLADGSKYVGPWVDDTPHGSRGFCSFASGRFYQGEFANGHQHGEGCLTHPDGSTFVGQFHDGMKAGRGCAVYRSSAETTSCGLKMKMMLATYVGEFENDCFHGEGTYKWRDGRSYEGQWHTNNMHGHGKYTFTDGRSYEGQYKNGEKSGFGRYSWPDGRKYVGQILHGVWQTEQEIMTPAEEPQAAMDQRKYGSRQQPFSFPHAAMTEGEMTEMQLL